MQQGSNRAQFPKEKNFSWPIIWNCLPSMPYPSPYNPWPYIITYNNTVPPSFPPQVSFSPSQLVNTRAEQPQLIGQIHVSQQVRNNSVKIQEGSAEAVNLSQDMSPVGRGDKARQKFGRNILSNIFHMAIKKILSLQFSKHLEYAIKKQRVTITVREFKSRLSEKDKQSSSYISSKCIKKLLLGNPIGATKLDIEFRKILRILIKIYIHHYHIPHIYHSGKIKKQSRFLHLSNLRKLAKRIAKL